MVAMAFVVVVAMALVVVAAVVRDVVVAVVVAWAVVADGFSAAFGVSVWLLLQLQLREA